MSTPRELPERFGRYRILRQLGTGGMGAVYLAEDTQLSRRVALKVPHFDVTYEWQALERFLREARSVASIRHEHICLVHDLGQIDGIHYLTMEYVEGTPLRQLIDQGRAWEPRRAVELLSKVARAVQVLHTHDVIHRDLKPGNIMVRPNGEPVLLDFGLARSVGLLRMDLTATGTPLGTPAYMSPEQLRGDKEIGPATDIYGLGVIFYELLTGELPFPGLSFAELTGQILFGKLEPPSRRRPGLDGALDAICMKAMARNAVKRFTTAEELAYALAAYRQPLIQLRGVFIGRFWQWLRQVFVTPRQQQSEEPPFTFDAILPQPQIDTPDPIPSPESLGTHDSAAVSPSLFESESQFELPAVSESSTDYSLTVDKVAPPEQQTINTPCLDQSTAPSSQVCSPPSAAPESIVPARTDSDHSPEDDDLPSLCLPSVPPQAGSNKPPAPPDVSLLDEASSPRRFGRYELLRKLGQGDTGVVYLARHIQQGWQAAIKIMPGARFSRPDCAQRLLREARVGAGLRHPNICQILDAGSADGEFYLAMEYLEGQTLRACLQGQSNGLVLSLACYYGHQIVDALHYLGRKQLAHRDIKPGNVMVGTGDRLKLMDLGLTKVPDPEEGRLTISGIVLGTPAYMAPEQIQDASKATYRSDLYSAGATLFEMVTGCTPFRGPSPIELMLQAMQQPPPDPRTIRPDLPEGLAKVILRLLEKDPARRPEHEEVLDVLLKVDPGEELAHTFVAPGYRDEAPPRVDDADEPRPSLVARIDRAAEEIEAQDADDLVALLPTENGKPCLGSYYLGERAGDKSAVNTYHARHFLDNRQYIVRLLPLALSQLDPEQLQGLLGSRVQLRQLSARTRQLARLRDLGKVKLSQGAFNTLYYMVEDRVSGQSLEVLIGSGKPTDPGIVVDCLKQALEGLLALHAGRMLHGNLHPGKLFYNAAKQRLRIADLTCTRHLPLPADETAAPRTVNRSAINDMDWFGNSYARRRQYLAPEVLCDGEAAGLLTEQYILGVVFIELLAARFIRTHQNDLKLLKCVQEDLQDCLSQIADTSPGLERVLRRMTAINPQARFRGLDDVLRAIAKSDRLVPPPKPDTRLDPSHPTPIDPAALGREDPYDVFISYRRNSGAEVARAIKERLLQRNLAVFLDVDALGSCQFNEKLLTAIEQIPNFVVILTEGSLERCGEPDDWLRREIAHAIQAGRHIVPVRMQTFQMPKELPKEIGSLATSNWVPYTHEYFKEFIDRLITFLKTRSSGKAERVS